MFLVFGLGENADLCIGERVGLPIYLGVSFENAPWSINSNRDLNLKRNHIREGRKSFPFCLKVIGISAEYMLPPRSAFFY